MLPANCPTKRQESDQPVSHLLSAEKLDKVPSHHRPLFGNIKHYCRQHHRPPNTTAAATRDPPRSVYVGMRLGFASFTEEVSLEYGSKSRILNLSNGHSIQCCDRKHDRTASNPTRGNNLDARHQVAFIYLQHPTLAATLRVSRGWQPSHSATPTSCLRFAPNDRHNYPDVRCGR